MPRIVLREVRLGEDKTVREVIDGQQRITTVQNFFQSKLKLPTSLKDVHRSLPGSYYSDLDADLREFVDEELEFQTDIVKGISDPSNSEHQTIATEIFWRLQQGETLNYMEKAHSRLSSLVRNFVVKYADDQRFDYKNYQPIDNNPDKHPFFSVVRRDNNRMQHLALLTRLLLLEDAGGPTEIKRGRVGDFVENFMDKEGIGNYSFEETDIAQSALRNMREFYEVFEGDPALGENNGLPILKTEYFIISVYLLLRHLCKHYAFGDDERLLFREFVYDFHDRWKNSREEDIDVQVFSNNRQQSGGEIKVRQRIIRQLFFEYADEQGHEILAKDSRRSFDESERIRIYRRDDGLCQECLSEGKPEEEAQVSWDDYEADHVIPHSKGGKTVIENGQVLCEYHNRRKGNSQF